MEPAGKLDLQLHAISSCRYLSLEKDVKSHIHSQINRIVISSGLSPFLAGT